MTERIVPALGMGVLLGIAWAFSTDRRRVPWRVLAWGIGLQLGLGLLLLRTEPGRRVFLGVNDVAVRIVSYTEAGVAFVFGPLAASGPSIFLSALPIIVFSGTLFAILYHWGVVQRVVKGLAWALTRSMGVSGAESLAAVANVFVGMTEAPLLVRPYVERMTTSELFTLMTTGMATVAGSVLVAYVVILGGGDFAGHLVTASLLSAPAALAIAKLMVPETGVPETGGGTPHDFERQTVNTIDAAAQGGLAALRLAAYVGALLVAFVALVALANDVTAGLGGLVGVPDLTLQRIFGWVFAPLALLMGVPWSDATTVGGLMGIKTVLNEFFAYQELRAAMDAASLSPRSAVITSYALCGFANFGSLGILLGGLGGMAPSRRSELARLGMRSILAGTLATLMTGCVAGLLL